MQVTSNIPNGSGRILQVSDDQIEIEAIAYCKSARYFFVEISDIHTSRTQEIVVVPDSLFRIRTFEHKLSASIWISESGSGEWQRVTRMEGTPERVRCWVSLEAGKRYWLTSEPPYRYIDTTQEIFHIAEQYPKIAGVHYLGYSMEHRPILALRISDPHVPPGEEDRPVIHIAAGEHGSESAGEEIARGMLHLVLSEEGDRFQKDYIFDFVFNTNPDGNYHGWHNYNLRDWKEHNYHDTVDRSWHHEFVPYMKGETGVYSPETVASMEWLKKTRPACYFSMHSWEGKDGMPGAYHSHPDELSPQMGAAVMAITEIAKAQCAASHMQFLAYDHIGDHLHLAQFLMRNELSVAYLPEGNYTMGREELQKLGWGILSAMLKDARIPLKTLDRSRWDKLIFPPSKKTNSILK